MESEHAVSLRDVELTSFGQSIILRAASQCLLVVLSVIHSDPAEDVLDAECAPLAGKMIAQGCHAAVGVVTELLQTQPETLRSMMARLFEDLSVECVDW
jgi:hypothetical protein